MQAIPNDIRKSVVFIFYKNGESEYLCGTAFFIAVPLPNVTKQFLTYLVTAKHVIKNIEIMSKKNKADGKVYIRLNNNDGDANHSLRTEISDWKFHPIDTSVDAAVLSGTPPHKTFDYRNIPISMAVTDEFIKKEEIGAGDEVFLAGLFNSHYGKKKNLPIIRTGNIALMPEEKVNTRSFGDLDAYLIEARSLGGLSGSPVFVYLGHMRAKTTGINLGGDGSIFGWLGLMHGHWDIDEDSVDSEIDSTNIVGKSVNMGIGIVVPATKIIEIINSHDFTEQRKRVAATINQSITPTKDAPRSSQNHHKSTHKKGHS